MHTSFSFFFTYLIEIESLDSNYQINLKSCYLVNSPQFRIRLNGGLLQLQSNGPHLRHVTTLPTEYGAPQGTHKSRIWRWR